MNNNNDKLINDFHLFQNEVLGEMKNLESKMNEKIVQINHLLEEQNLRMANKIREINSRFDNLSSQIQDKKNSENLDFILQPFKKKIEEGVSKLEIKLNLVEKDLDNACFKYDKIFSNNLNVPGLIGSSCPYDTLRPFLEYVNIKITELIKAKEKQAFDSKKYKEKLETLINNNKAQFETAQKKINEYCKKGFEQCDTNCKDRINIIEERIEALRIENGEFSYQLKQRSEEIKIEWEKLDNFEKNFNIRYNEELEKYNDIIDKIGKKVDKSKSDFNLIKMRFTELSEFIKDIRFRRNINLNTNNNNPYNNYYNSFKERKQYRDMSTKIDFTKRQKLKDGEGEENEEKAKDILEPFDYYAHFGIDPILKEEDDENLNENNNLNNQNKIINFSNNENNSFSNNNENSIFNQEENNKENKDNFNNEINSNNNETKKNSEKSSVKFMVKNDNKKELLENKIKDININKSVKRSNNRFKTQNYKLNSNNSKSLNMINVYLEQKKNNINKNSSNNLNLKIFSDIKENKSEKNLMDNTKISEKNIINKKEDNSNLAKIPEINKKENSNLPKIPEVNKKEDSNLAKIPEKNIINKIEDSNHAVIPEKNLINKNEDNNYPLKLNLKEKNINNKVKQLPKKENSETKKQKTHTIKEQNKLNDLILDAKFKNNQNNNLKENLSESYILMKKKIEEMQKVKILYGGKSPLQYHQMSIPLSLNLQNSRNNTINNNLILNQFNGFSNNDLKKGNIEDLYYSQIKKDKINNIFMDSSQILRASSQDNIFNKTVDKRMLPNIYNYQNIINSNEKKNMLKSYSNRNYMSSKGYN